MTPKEKAIYLFNSYVKLLPLGSNVERAKKCSLIAVDELILQNGELYLNGIDADYYRKINSFLFEVKQEIEKL